MGFMAQLAKRGFCFGPTPASVPRAMNQNEAGHIVLKPVVRVVR